MCPITNTYQVFLSLFHNIISLLRFLKLHTVLEKVLAGTQAHFKSALQFPQ